MNSSWNFFFLQKLAAEKMDGRAGGECW